MNAVSKLWYAMQEAQKMSVKICDVVRWTLVTRVGAWAFCVGEVESSSFGDSHELPLIFPADGTNSSYLTRTAQESTKAGSTAPAQADPRAIGHNSAQSI